MPTIFKTLPNGRTVTREVTPSEYINNGWATNGWAATSKLQELAEKVLTDRTINSLKQKSNEELRGLQRKWTIAKKLPNGRWVTRRVYGGEYQHEGWAKQGWIIPSYMHVTGQKPASNSKLARDYYIRRIINQQDWWRPKRSVDQARAFYRPMTALINQELGHNSQEDIAKLQSGLYKPNPKWRQWLNKGQIWMAQRWKRLYRQSLKGPAGQRHATRVELYKRYNDRVRAPPKVIPVEREKLPQNYNYRHIYTH